MMMVYFKWDYDIGEFYVWLVIDYVFYCIMYVVSFDGLVCLWVFDDVFYNL